ncbi:MAG: amidohydrolase family protein [Candidatus Aenigmarchaeota archaeon]|nr:amidohydrolase family protein [Candidatus Aenigmarchaeota archaeon]
MNILIRNALTPDSGRLRKCDLRISGERIDDFSFTDMEPEDDNEVMDAEGLLMLPGIIDPHVHLREPGLTHKEDFMTGSHAAAAGGVTTVLDMPNSIPPAKTAAGIEEKRKLSKGMVVNHAFHICGFPGTISEVSKAKNVPATKVFMNDTTGCLMVSDRYHLMNIFSQSRLVAVHAEGEKVSEAIDISSRTGKPVYCCHISAGSEIIMINNAKADSRKVFCEVTPHHLFLNRKNDRSPFTKMKPPLKSEADVESLWKAVNDGIVDTIGSDHAPHTVAEKESGNPPFGVPGLETSLPLMLTAVRDRKTSYGKVLDLMCRNPAKIFGISGRGEIRKGNYADIVLADIKGTKKVEGSKLFTKCKWSPFEGMELTGWPKYTFVNGKLVYDSGRINEIPAMEAEIA